MLNNSNCYDNKKNTIENIVYSIVNCKDGIYVEEVYAKEASFQKDGTFGNWVSLMICLSSDFKNHDLYDTLNQAEESVDFDLVLSTEINAVERGHGIVIWKKTSVVREGKYD